MVGAKIVKLIAALSRFGEGTHVTFVSVFLGCAYPDEHDNLFLSFCYKKWSTSARRERQDITHRFPGWFPTKRRGRASYRVRSLGMYFRALAL